MARKENDICFANLFAKKTAIDIPIISDTPEPPTSVRLAEPVVESDRPRKKVDTETASLLSYAESSAKRGRPATMASKAMKSESGKKVPISARVSESFKKRLRKATLEVDKTVDGLLIELAEEWLKKHEV